MSYWTPKLGQDVQVVAGDHAGTFGVTLRCFYSPRLDTNLVELRDGRGATITVPLAVVRPDSGETETDVVKAPPTAPVAAPGPVTASELTDPKENVMPKPPRDAAAIRAAIVKLSTQGDGPGRPLSTREIADRLGIKYSLCWYHLSRARELGELPGQTTPTPTTVDATDTDDADDDVTPGCVEPAGEEPCVHDPEHDGEHESAEEYLERIAVERASRALAEIPMPAPAPTPTRAAMPAARPATLDAAREAMDDLYSLVEALGFDATEELTVCGTIVDAVSTTKANLRAAIGAI
ncbi:MAG: sigma-70 region 4 domain-containing protein [Promicromonosporaceae bacterium]|nr:sigma-70 region 4 domain-containing protein [Promicromonosporaceae bacterium]